MNGELFASWSRERLVSPPPSISTRLKSSERSEGSEFEVVRVIMEVDGPIGLILVRSDLTELRGQALGLRGQDRLPWHMLGLGLACFAVVLPVTVDRAADSVSWSSTARTIEAGQQLLGSRPETHGG